MNGTAGNTRAQVLDTIREHIATRRYAPSVRDIMTAVPGLNSPSAVVYHLRALRAAGAISYESDVARSIVILDDRCAHCGGSGLQP